MYRLMLYFLLGLWLGVVTLSVFGALHFNFIDILLQGVYLITICNLSNYIISKLFGAKTNLESASITALILTLIVGPFSFFENIFVLTFVGVVAMASKYVLAVRKKHIFNPAAIAVLLSAIFLKFGASWWVGSIHTLPIIVFGGLLVWIKIKRMGLIVGFLTVYFLTAFLFGSGLTLNSFLVPPVWFFVFVMLIEPLTSPTTRNLQIGFGAGVATAFFALGKIIPGYPYGLESALLIGNLASAVVSPSRNFILNFLKKEKVAEGTWAFYFEPVNKLSFRPGQFLEWTYPHKNPDSRGVRRYFTISSSPGEGYVMVTTRIFKKSSSFKKAWMEMKKGEQVTVSGSQGEFVLPQDVGRPLCFIAGGIGITPFRSMVVDLWERGEKRDIVLVYANGRRSEAAFGDVWERAAGVGVKTTYVMTETEGRVDGEMLKKKVPDYRERVFYVSGPQAMVEAIEGVLLGMGVRRVKTDFFPGYSTTTVPV